MAALIDTGRIAVNAAQTANRPVFLNPLHARAAVCGRQNLHQTWTVFTTSCRGGGVNKSLARIVASSVLTGEKGKGPVGCDNPAVSRHSDTLHEIHPEPDAMGLLPFFCATPPWPCQFADDTEIFVQRSETVQSRIQSHVAIATNIFLRNRFNENSTVQSVLYKLLARQRLTSAQVISTCRPVNATCQGSS
jgi:hypothetical protein